jgi:hypothetical protein
MIEHYALIQIALKKIPELKEKLRSQLDSNDKQRDRMVNRANARLKKLALHRSKLLHLYYTSLIDDEQFKAEQDRITAEVRDATEALANQHVEYAEVEGIITEALEVVANCQQAYREAPVDLRQKFNQLFFKRLFVDTDGVARTDLSDEMSILVGADIAPRFERAKRELVLAPVEAAPGGDLRRREVVFSGVGSSKEPLVEVRGIEPLSPGDRLGLLRA